LTDFTSSDDLYFDDAGTTGDVDSGDTLTIDTEDDGLFFDQGQLVSGSTSYSLQTVTDPVFELELNAPNTDAANTEIPFESSGETTADALSTVGVEADVSSSVPAGSLVTDSGTNSFSYVVGSYSGSSQSTNVDVIGTNGDSGSNLAGQSFEEQSISSVSDTEADTTSGDQTINSDGSITVNVGSDPSLADGDRFFVSNGDKTFEPTDDTILIATAASGTSSVSAVGEPDATVSESSNIVQITGTGTEDSIDIDDFFLNDGPSVASSIDTAFSDNGISASADYNYAGNNKLRIQSTSTDADSFVEAFSAGTGTDVSGSGNLDIRKSGNGVSTRRDFVEFGSSLSDGDSVPGSEVSSLSELNTPARSSTRVTPL
jgi:hypothetical protein